MRVISLFDKTGALGAIVAAMGCASCYPALGALGAAVGLSFLAQFEGVFINTLLPVFAAIALAANLLAWFSHRKLLRLLAGIAGPSMVLATPYLFWTDNWSTYLFYAGLVLMLVVSIWDITSPPNKTCEVSAETSPGVETHRQVIPSRWNCSPASRVLNAGTASLKQCRLSFASSTMSARAVALCYAPTLVTAAFIVPLEPCHVRQFKQHARKGMMRDAAVDLDDYTWPVRGRMTGF